MPNQDMQTEVTAAQEAGVVVEEKRTLKASDKKALDKMVNRLEAEDGWEVVELGKKEKFGPDGDITMIFSAVLKKDTQVSVL